MPQALKTIFVGAAYAAAMVAQHSSFKLSNPFQSPEDRAQGAIIFRQQCASCHGADGKGGHGGPDLTRGQFRHAVSEEAMLRVVMKGIPGTAMPGFTLNGAKAWQVISYVGSFNTGQAGTTGDAKRGGELVAAQGCAKCHSGNAPALAEAAVRLSPSELRQAIVEPGAEVAPEYWAWRGTLRDGTVVEGRRLNEDTFSIQVMEKGGRLRTVQKDGLAKVELAQVSPMPSFRGKLSEKDLEDVVAYLESLR